MTIEERMGKAGFVTVVKEGDKIITAYEPSVKLSDAIRIAKEYAEGQKKFVFGKLINCITKRFGFFNAGQIANDYHETTKLATDEDKPLEIYKDASMVHFNFEKEGVE
jgi:hypothetical protein